MKENEGKFDFLAVVVKFGFEGEVTPWASDGGGWGRCELGEL